MKVTTLEFTKGSYVKFVFDGQTYSGELQEFVSFGLLESVVTRSQANLERWWKISKRDQTFRALKLGETGVKKDQKFYGTQAQLRNEYPDFRRAYARAAR